MRFSELASTLQKLEQLDSRNEMTVELAGLYKKLDVDEIENTFYLLTGRLAPKYVDLEFNFSRKLILKSLEKATNDLEAPKRLYKELGDLGLVVENVDAEFTISSNELGQLDNKSKTEELDINGVHFVLNDIASAEGKGSQESKINKFIELISKLSPIGSKYATRIIIGDLRLGISDKTLLDSLSWFIKSDKSLRKTLDLAYGFRADIGYIAKVALSSNDPEADLLSIKLQPGAPIASKLVEREASSEAVWKRMPNCFVQPKLDGLRGQLHFSEGKGHVFSRNMENMTDNFPDLVKAMQELNVESIILDSEIIGFDTEKNTYLTYQETMQRRRKYDVAEFTDKIPVKSMCFDILYLNGEDLSQRNIDERIIILKETLKSSEILEMLETKQMQSEDELGEYFSDKVNEGLEGIITKQVGTTYEPGTRNYKWIKLKANTRSDLVDTIDVVVLGYYSGRGQRAKFGLGALLTGVYDPEEDKYYSVGKVGSGMTDEIFSKIKNDLDKITIDKKPENIEVDSTLFPDVWVEPKIVIEIDADEITRSPNHTAAKGIKTNVPKDKDDRGLSVRFPRLKFWDRDKDYPNTVTELVKMYELRKS